jgi:hypothetical protein
MLRVHLDTETDPICTGEVAPRLACVQYATPVGPEVLERHRALEYIPQLLKPGHTLVGHNIAYDMVVLCREGFTRQVLHKYRAGEVECTMVNQILFDIATGTGPAQLDLGSCCAWWDTEFRPDKTDQWRTRYSELAHLPTGFWPQEAVAYAKGDVTAVSQLDAEQRKVAHYIRNPAWHARNAFWLHLSGVGGMPIDIDQVRRYHARVHERVQRDRRELFDEGLIDHTGKRNTKAAKDRAVAAFEALGLPTPTTASGGVGLDADACEASGDPLLVKYAAYGSAKTRYKRVLCLYEGLIHPTYNYPMETGRTSSRTSKLYASDQIQNPPKEPGYRECYVPPPGGWMLCSTDFNAFELAGVSQAAINLGIESDMAPLINSGKDAHLGLAVSIYNKLHSASLSEDEFQAQRKAKDPQALKARDYAKNCNFGLSGGMGPPTFAVTTGLDLETSKVLVALFKSQWSQARAMFSWSAEATKLGDYTFEQFGSQRLRKLYSPSREDNDRSYSKRLNTTFQGLCADAAMDAGWALTWACALGEDLDTGAPSILHGCRIAAFLHDEFLTFISPPGVGSDASISDKAKEACRVQIQYAQKWFPDLKLSAEPALMARWCKSADAVWRDGELVPWEPPAGWDHYLATGELVRRPG